MELRTYTRLWSVERRLYKLYDFTLPVPVPVKTIGVVIGTGLPWLVLLHAFGVPFHPPWQVVYFGPPAVLAWRLNKPVVEGKRLGQLLSSQTRYLLQPRTFTRLAPWHPPRRITVTAATWSPTRRPGGPNLPVPDGDPVPSPAMSTDT